MTCEELKRVGAIILAAGMSKRMGQAKLILPYKGGTVLGTVLSTLNSAGISPLITVTGGAGAAVEGILRDLPFEVVIANNPQPARSEMMDSLRIGMGVLPSELDAFLIVLGDQPQIQGDIVYQLVQLFHETGHSLIIPSYQMRRGHPWLIGREYWAALVGLEPQQTMRDFLRQNSNQIRYLEVNSASILEDLDTPEDYKRATGAEITDQT